MKSTVGRPRIVTDAHVAAILAWYAARKSMKQLARELDLSKATVQYVIDRGGQYKQPSPELRQATVNARRARRKALAAGGWL